jgi:hypothetical protein
VEDVEKYRGQQTAHVERLNDKNLREQQLLRRRITKKLGESGIKCEMQKEIRGSKRINGHHL